MATKRQSIKKANEGQETKDKPGDSTADLAEVFALIDAGERFEDYDAKKDNLALWKERRAQKKGAGR